MLIMHRNPPFTFIFICKFTLFSNQNKILSDFFDILTFFKPKSVVSFLVNYNNHFSFSSIIHMNSLSCHLNIELREVLTMF